MAATRLQFRMKDRPYNLESDVSETENVASHSYFTPQSHFSHALHLPKIGPLAYAIEYSISVNYD